MCGHYGVTDCGIYTYIIAPAGVQNGEVLHECVSISRVRRGKYYTRVQYLSVLHSYWCNDICYILYNIKLVSQSGLVNGKKLATFTGKNSKTSRHRQVTSALALDFQQESC